MKGGCFDTRGPSRRSLLGTLIPTGAAGLLTSVQASETAPWRDALKDEQSLGEEDVALLEEVEKASFLYFWEQTDPQTGLIKDRCNVRAPDQGIVASIAATGFGLTALCIGHQRKYVSLNDVTKRVATTLKFLRTKMPTQRGFFYHWANVHTGERIWESEVSSIDTAILLCGVLTARMHFRNAEISRLALESLTGSTGRGSPKTPLLLPHGWSPEVGFLQYKWDFYSELMMMYLLGMGSFTIRCRYKRGMHGNECRLNMTGCDMSAPMRLCRASVFPSLVRLSRPA